MPHGGGTLGLGASFLGEQEGMPMGNLLQMDIFLWEIDIVIILEICIIYERRM